jgi:hypothetical protein
MIEFLFWLLQAAGLRLFLTGAGSFVKFEVVTTDIDPANERRIACA